MPAAADCLNLAGCAAHDVSALGDQPVSQKRSLRPWLWVGFFEKAADTAGIHQYGLPDEASLPATFAPYPVCVLLGPWNS